MAPRLIIANKAYSSWSMRPWLVMRCFEIAFDEVVIPLDEPGSKAAFARYSPAGKVPILVDGDLTIWDSLAIVEYLAERHPDRPIWPRDAAARATARALSAEMHSGFAALRRCLPMNIRRDGTPAHLSAADGELVLADVARIEAAWSEARARFGAGGPFLFGGFCAADAMFAPVVNRLQAYAVPVGDVALAYMTAIAALPAWRDWQAAALAEGWHLTRIDAV